jgi:hypothetical protein
MVSHLYILQASKFTCVDDQHAPYLSQNVSSSEINCLMLGVRNSHVPTYFLASKPGFPGRSLLIAQ